METLAIVLSVLALAVAIASLFLNWRAHRRSGAKVHVRVVRQSWSVPAANEAAWELIEVQVENSGLADIQVTDVDLEIDGADEPVPASAAPGSHGDVLRGLHTETWVIPASLLLQAGLTLGTGGTVRYRACVTLGNRDQIHSKWHTYP